MNEVRRKTCARAAAALALMLMLGDPAFQVGGTKPPPHAPQKAGDTLAVADAGTIRPPETSTAAACRV